MKNIFNSLIICVFTLNSFAQKDFIQIETNKTLCLISFLETSANKSGSSKSFQKYIKENLGNSSDFTNLIKAYSQLKLNYAIKRQEFPVKRASSTTTKSLLWQMASNAKDINDFSERIAGLLPHQTHTRFIDILKKAESFYEDLIWNKEQNNILDVQNKLNAYKTQIEAIYLKVSRFYNTPWNTDVPFKIMLYPIPLQSGNTTALQQGNTLICGFLSRNKNDYKAQLGVIIHEMCHLLYKEQEANFQYQIDEWFANSESDFAFLAYSYLDEALATAIGNGWAYKEIHKKLDDNDWYDNTYIDGFAKSIYSTIEAYLKNNKTIDENFVEKSIEAFRSKFPRANEATAILMNDIYVFANTEDDEKINIIADGFYEYFDIRYMWFTTPIFSLKSKKNLKVSNATKLFVIESNNVDNINKIQEIFPSLKLQTPINSIDILRDEISKSTLIIINTDNIAKLKSAYKLLSEKPYLKSGANYKIE